ncbi:anti-sigma-D factor RsdA [Micromonospora sp. CA-240977]|uniref:anti-sigma-D factor RsdA n=1 Tax=Micromonospora sp. CA-240977 TaxID=3239957 RepID=UPI003D8CAAB9
MTAAEPVPTPPDPVEQADQLLDAIGRGERPPAGHPHDDAVIALLADWHADVVGRSEEFEAAGEPAAPAAVPRAAQPDVATVAHRPAPSRPPWTGRRRRPFTDAPAGVARRRGRRPAYAAAALALVTVVGGLWFGALRAEPGGLLWPVTELVYAERAQSVVAEREVGRMLEQARQDLADGRHDEARRQLERAEGLLSAMGADTTAVRLRREVEELRLLLPPAPAAEPSSPAGDIATGATPVPSVTEPAASTSQGSLAAVPKPTRTPAGSRSTTPATRTHPTGPPADVPAARPSAPAASSKRHLPPTPTARPSDVPSRAGDVPSRAGGAPSRQGGAPSRAGGAPSRQGGAQSHRDTTATTPDRAANLRASHNGRLTER